MVSWVLVCGKVQGSSEGTGARLEFSNCAFSNVLAHPCSPYPHFPLQDGKAVVQAHSPMEIAGYIM